MSNIPCLTITQVQSGYYRYFVECDGISLYEDEGFTSIAEVISEAIDCQPPFAGFTIRYAGLPVGTFSDAELRKDPEAVARLAVGTAQKLMPE
jgi:hypothetical protein